MANSLPSPRNARQFAGALLCCVALLISWSCTSDNSVAPPPGGTAGGKLRGVITGSNGRPLDSVFVLLRPGGYNGLSDTAGTYSITNIVPGTYTAYYIKDKYHIPSVPLLVPDSSVLIHDVQLQLITYQVQGIITANNSPLADAKISINGVEQTTDAAGRFLFSGAAPGAATVSIVHKLLGKIDTSVTLPAENLRFDFGWYRLNASVYRYLRPYEKLRQNGLRDLAVRTPLATSVVVDNWLGYNSHDMSDCNLYYYDAGIAAGRSHRITISSPDYYTIDTVLTGNRDFSCGFTGATALTYTLLPIPYSRFNWPLTPGTKLKYAYNSTQKLDHTIYRFRKGYHYWRVVDSAIVQDPTLVAGKKTVYSIENAGFDSVTYSAYPNPPVISFTADTTYFTIEVCESAITVNYPMVGVLTGYITPPEVIGGGTAREFRAGVGLYYLNYSNFTNSQGKGEEIKFLEQVN